LIFIYGRPSGTRWLNPVISPHDIHSLSFNIAAACSFRSWASLFFRRCIDQRRATVEEELCEDLNISREEKLCFANLVVAVRVYL
jgi:hypothetical protein